MSRFHPSINDIVSKSERIRVYTEAISFYEEKKSGYGCDYRGLGICLLLPCILFKLDHYMDNYQKIFWKFQFTEEVFPEIKPFVADIKSFILQLPFKNRVCDDDSINELRINSLKECLKLAKKAER